MASTFSFTKLIVHDLQKMSAFYQAAYGLKDFDRVQADNDGDPIDEIMLGVDSAHGPGSIMLLKFTERAAPTPGAVVLGFQTDDLEGLIDAVLAAGGSQYGEIKTSEVAPVRVAFTIDPEGNHSENVQVIAPIA
jgi:predicted enzyme related to lactoylglutathione lyase